MQRFSRVKKRKRARNKRKHKKSPPKEEGEESTEGRRGRVRRRKKGSRKKRVGFLFVTPTTEYTAAYGGRTTLPPEKSFTNPNDPKCGSTQFMYTDLKRRFLFSLLPRALHIGWVHLYLHSSLEDSPEKLIPLILRNIYSWSILNIAHSTLI